MFSAAELADMTATVARTIGPDSGLGVSIVLHRGSTTLPAQVARLVRPNAQDRTVATDGTESEQFDLYVIGLPDMDIQARDRFALDGLTYEVNGVHPLRQIDTVATARVVQ